MTLSNERLSFPEAALSSRATFLDELDGQAAEKNHHRHSDQQHESARRHAGGISHRAFDGGGISGRNSRRGDRQRGADKSRNDGQALVVLFDHGLFWFGLVWLLGLGASNTGSHRRLKISEEGEMGGPEPWLTK